MALLLLGLIACQEPTRVSFFTQANCEECNGLIQAELKKLPGVDSVGWDFETSLTTVKYFPDKISEDQLQEALSKTGFETQFYPADDSAQALLPECCRQPIDRKLKRVEPIIH